MEFEVQIQDGDEWYFHNQQIVLKQVGKKYGKIVMGYNGEFEVLALAGLLAAAPKLLEALKLLVEKYDKLPEGIFLEGFLSSDFEQAKNIISEVVEEGGFRG